MNSKKQQAFKYFIIAVRLALGGLFIYAGIQKFKAPEPKPAKAPTEVSQAEKPAVPEHVQKIRAYIGGLKQTGYFWPMLGITELLGGLLLVSQTFALLGGIVLLPVTLNIFLFEVYLGGGDVGEIIVHGLYLLGNLLILAYGFPRLKLAFITPERQFHNITS